MGPSTKYVKADPLFVRHELGSNGQINGHEPLRRRERHARAHTHDVSMIRMMPRPRPRPRPPTHTRHGPHTCHTLSDMYPHRSFESTGSRPRRLAGGVEDSQRQGAPAGAVGLFGLTTTREGWRTPRSSSSNRRSGPSGAPWEARCRPCPPVAARPAVWCPSRRQLRRAVISTRVCV